MLSTDRDLHERWLTGVPLDFAWRAVPDPDLQAQCDGSGDNLRRQDSVISEMKMEMADRLVRHQFGAIGVRVSNDALPTLAELPPHFFARPEFVDWDESTVRAFGEIFQEVRVIGMPSFRDRRQTASDRQRAIKGGQRRDWQAKRGNWPARMRSARRRWRRSAAPHWFRSYKR